MLFSSLFSVSPRLSEKEEYILQFDSDFYKSADKDGQPEDGQDRVWLDSHPLGSCRVVAALVAQKPKARGSESPGRAGAAKHVLLAQVQTPSLSRRERHIQCPPVRTD